MANIEIATQTETEKVKKNTNATYDNNKKTIEKLQNENSLLKSDKEKLQNENSLLKSDKDKLQNENSLLKLDKDKLQNENSLLKSDKEKLQNENSLLKSDKDKLNSEIPLLNEIKSKWDELTNRKNIALQVFSIFVSVLTTFSNIFHVGGLYASLYGEKTTIFQDIVAYGCMSVFDLAVILFTVKGKHKETLIFSILVGIINFLSIAEPFKYIHELEYAKRLLIGLIFAFMFAYVPYRNSYLFVEK